MNANHRAAWVAAIEGWTGWMLASGRPQTTIRTRRCHLNRVSVAMSDRSPWIVTLDDLVGWTGSQNWQTETRRGYRASLRLFYAWAVRTGRAVLNPCLDLPAVGRPRPNPRPASDSAYEQSLLGADDRTRLMICLAAEAGLRCGEVAAVHTRDVIPDLSDWSLIVQGKGAKQRIIPLTPNLSVAIRMAPAGYLFPGADHGHLSARWVSKLIASRLPDGWTMHSLRHRFATRAFAVDHDVFTVQEMLGHASPETTRLYVQVPSIAARRLVLAAARI